jgi:glycerol-3-phosphate dehydrogenase (NAD(P)+)
MKGVELGTTKRMSEVIIEVADVPGEQVAVVSGPNLAKEIAAGQPAATVVACADEDAATRLQAACLTRYFRPYTNLDVVGCELGGAVKNVIALATGMAEGMGFGDNTKASLITRGLAETARLGAALGADPLTFSGLAGLGDLVATCTSPLSRNRTFGERLGRGETLEQIQAQKSQTAEGVKSCRSILDLAWKHDVDMPITEHVVKVVHEGMTPQEMVRSLMSREAKSE